MQSTRLQMQARKVGETTFKPRSDGAAQRKPAASSAHSPLSHGCSQPESPWFQWQFLASYKSHGTGFQDLFLSSSIRLLTDMPQLLTSLSQPPSPMHDTQILASVTENLWEQHRQNFTLLSWSLSNPVIHLASQPGGQGSVQVQPHTGPSTCWGSSRGQTLMILQLERCHRGSVGILFLGVGNKLN